MLKMLHFVIGHKEIKVETIEIEGGELSLYACACGKTSWRKHYRLIYLAEKFDIGKEIIKGFRQVSPLLECLPTKPATDAWESARLKPFPTLEVDPDLENVPTPTKRR